MVLIVQDCGDVDEGEKEETERGTSLYTRFAKAVRLPEVRSSEKKPLKTMVSEL